MLSPKKMCAEGLQSRLWYNSFPHSSQKSCSLSRTQLVEPVTQFESVAFHTDVGKGRSDDFLMRGLGYVLLMYFLNEICKHSVD